jgi:hypothetical protein
VLWRSGWQNPADPVPRAARQPSVAAEAKLLKKKSATAAGNPADGARRRPAKGQREPSQLPIKLESFANFHGTVARMNLSCPTHSSAHAAVIHIIGDFLAYVCQFEEFFFGVRIFVLCGEFPVFDRFVSQIIRVLMHGYSPRLVVRVLLARVCFQCVSDLLLRTRYFVVW